MQKSSFFKTLEYIENYVGVNPSYCRVEKDVGCVECCPLVITASMQMGQIDGRTDGRQTIALRFLYDAFSQCLK